MGRFTLVYLLLIFVTTVFTVPAVHAMSSAPKNNPAWKESGRIQIKNIDFYRLNGEASDIGLQIGGHAPTAARLDGMPIYMADFLNFFADAIPLTRGKPWLLPAVNGYFDFQYYRHMRETIPSEDREVLKNMAGGFEYKVSAVEKMFMNPDVAHMVIAEHWDKTESSYHELASQLLTHPMGCTSFISGLDGRGEMLFARTFDYSGVGYNDKYNSVFFVARQGAYKYITMASAGTAPAVTQAINEHGLTLSLQNAFTHSVYKKGGHSIFTVNRRIMEEARSIEEAAVLCQQNLPATSWLIVLADTVKGYARAARLEVDPVHRQCHLVWPKTDDPFFVTTNFFASAAGQKVQLALGPGVFMDLHNRYDHTTARLQEILQAKGEVTVPDAVRLMGSRYSWELKRKGAFLPGSVSVKEQIGSFIIKPMTKEIWIANGAAPTNSTADYVYIRFDDLNVEKWQDFTQVLQFPLHDESFSVAPLLHDSGDALELWPASRHYQDAYLNLEHKKIPAAVANMDEVIRLAPTEPIYHLTRGMLRFKAEQFSSAAEDFTELLAQAKDPSQNINPYRQQLAKIFLAKSQDILGQRASALQHYQQLAADSETEIKIRAAAQGYLLKPYPKSEARWIAPNLQFLTVFKH